jgi:hypothetical protein
MKRVLYVLGSLLIISSPAWAQKNKVQISIFGGVNHHFSYGSYDDYVYGENDFPVMPSHTPPSFGIALAYYFNDYLSVEYDARLTNSFRVILLDPSDQDTLEIDTSRHVSMTLNFIMHVFSGNIRPYIFVGGGADKIIPKEKIYISERGYEIEVIAPLEHELVDPLINIGGGFQYSFNSSIGIRLDLRYIVTFSDPDRIFNFAGVAGLYLRF